MTLFQFALIRSWRKKSTLISLCIVPLLMVFMPTFWTGSGATGFNLFGVNLLTAAFLLVRNMMTDRVTGTVIRIFAAPVTTFKYLLENLMGYILLLWIQIFVFIQLGAGRYDWTQDMTIKLILGYWLFAAAAAAFSLAWNSLFKKRWVSDSMFSIAVSVMSLVGGVFVPLSFLPPWLQKLGMLFPNFWLSNILLDALGEQSYYGMGLSSAVLVLYIVIYLLIGSKRRLE